MYHNSEMGQELVPFPLPSDPWLSAPDEHIWEREETSGSCAAFWSLHLSTKRSWTAWATCCLFQDPPVLALALKTIRKVPLPLASLVLIESTRALAPLFPSLLGTAVSLVGSLWRRSPEIILLGSERRLQAHV